MKLVGQAITHTKFGRGTVLKKTDRMIAINFKEGEKKFIFPDSFRDFLVLENKKIQEEVEVLVQEHQAVEKEKYKEVECNERIYKLKVNPVSQVALGLISNTKTQVFSAWTATMGGYLSGKLKGQPRIPKRVQLNSACLLTECPKGEPEAKRKIIGAFMVKDDFQGELCKDGMVTSHEKYRLQLKEWEQLLFWDYFTMEAQGTRWGNVEFKYFSNTTMEKILLDMKEKITDPNNKRLSEEFLRYFQKVNKLPKEDC